MNQVLFVFRSVTCRWENVKVVTMCKVFGHSPKNAPPKRGGRGRGGREGRGEEGAESSQGRICFLWGRNPGDKHYIDQDLVMTGRVIT